MDFYCMKCRKTVKAEPISSKKAKNGATLFKSTCPKCRGKMARFGKA